MSAQFTPGPWTLETVATSAGSCHKIGPFPSLGVRDKTYACVYADGVRVGIDDRGGVCAVADELLANARLIAAAPDLLDVAQGVVTAYGDKLLPTHVEKHLLDGARAAIAKAQP